MEHGEMGRGRFTGDVLPWAQKNLGFPVEFERNFSSPFNFASYTTICALETSQQNRAKGKAPMRGKRRVLLFTGG
ncbi:uncharacterized protein LAJ45_05632 [Morchella importuna]|uniref:uncharacterized protein n=1 Tax=Morchella importuna TaxID=1174673 RepID=UPI001E8CC494|nr:uncharacterized protein LAJ45_05632 [Morchella importuna]KAH8150420.1 hypothetical protein LAJ45_05632 [Morchella importuna]